MEDQVIYRIQFFKRGIYRYGGWPLRYDHQLICTLPKPLQVSSIARDLQVRYKRRAEVFSDSGFPNLFMAEFEEDFE